ncbi:cytochrome c family protein [Pseudomonas sp. R5(2019)]|uniref:c-type cytochrome n=1 Tax=Pseudomonas sp. R5(2019) TaxID=2697566 RepID=UPI001411B447|nr:c-type cytochrome [Pseudomonas sp. R5(2019)]NBA96570.1 c-type cytochrome [Pseudomonas sp. R5(2019)]
MFSSIVCHRAPALVGITLFSLLGSAALHAAQCAPAQVEKGQQVFAGECGVCHSLKAGENLVGPNLHQLYGRASGSVAGFTYSQAMKTRTVKWDADNLDPFIAQPQAAVPGTYMPYAGLASAPDRQAVGCFLGTQG